MSSESFAFLLKRRFQIFFSDLCFSLCQLHGNSKTGVDALEEHPLIRRVTPHRKVIRNLKYVKGMSVTPHHKVIRSLKYVKGISVTPHRKVVRNLKPKVCQSHLITKSSAASSYTKGMLVTHRKVIRNLKYTKGNYDSHTSQSHLQSQVYQRYVSHISSQSHPQPQVYQSYVGRISSQSDP